MDNAYQDITVSDKMITNKLAKLCSEKAAGADAMSPWLLEEVHDLLVSPTYYFGSPLMKVWFQMTGR